MSSKKELRIAELSIEAGREILNYTPQLYRKLGSSEPIQVEPWATGVLLEIDNVRFLITAAHVLEKNKQPLNPEDVGIMVGNTFHILNGFVKYSATELHKQNTKVDLTIWRLDDQGVIDDIKQKYNFLSLDHIEIDHKTSNKFDYLIVGFPVTKSKLKTATKFIRAEPFIFLTNNASETKYESLGFEIHSNIMVNYRKRKIKNGVGNIVQGPDPYGMSGCGLWFFPDKNSTIVGGTIRLIAIMTEWNPNSSVLIGTRIHIVTEIIRKAFDLNVTPSQRTHINLS
jgi:hypothetical protein